MHSIEICLSFCAHEGPEARCCVWREQWSSRSLLRVGMICSRRTLKHDKIAIVSGKSRNDHGNAQP